jgi:hypothetical protein
MVRPRRWRRVEEVEEEMRKRGEGGKGRMGHVDPPSLSPLLTHSPLVCGARLRSDDGLAAAGMGTVGLAAGRMLGQSVREEEGV